MIMQPDLFDARCEDKFTAWVHSPAGGEIANHFIRLAYGLWRRGFKHYGSKGIVERLRWHYHLKKYRPARSATPSVAGGGKGVSEYQGARDEWKINNNYTARLARFAEEKEPRLKDFFEKRKMNT